ncbi:hypothetical protein ACIQZO_22720 [Streptomyces sp. NPDC097617]|uniref:hypothetical protein n=1 Tax=Streptomyces sp. NPDC097617 TaxID=3366091 RepID=UPI00380C0046
MMTDSHLLLDLFILCIVQAAGTFLAAGVRAVAMLLTVRRALRGARPGDRAEILRSVARVTLALRGRHE